MNRGYNQVRDEIGYIAYGEGLCAPEDPWWYPGSAWYGSNGEPPRSELTVERTTVAEDSNIAAHPVGFGRRWPPVWPAPRS